MATYAIGDIQGCLESLVELLALIEFDERRDRLWFTGDLVNRGPDSLGVLRLVHSLDHCSVTVLGNHDLHLLALHHDPQRRAKKGDTIEAVLHAPDRSELLEWLRHRPFMHRDTELGYTMVHAGLPVHWDLAAAAGHAREAESALRDARCAGFLADMYGNTPDQWTPDLRGGARLRYITNCFTRMRYCRRDGRLDLKTKVGLDKPAPGLVPWFMLPERLSATEPVVFGHWSTLRLTPAQEREYKVHPLDTGAVWGGMLSALRLEDRQRFCVRGLYRMPGEAAED